MPVRFIVQALGLAVLLLAGCKLPTIERVQPASPQGGSSPTQQAFQSQLQQQATPVDPSTITIKNATATLALMADEAVLQVQYDLNSKAEFYQISLSYNGQPSGSAQTTTTASFQAIITNVQAGIATAQVVGCVNPTRSTNPKANCGPPASTNGVSIPATNSVATRAQLNSLGSLFAQIRTAVLQMQGLVATYLADYAQAASDPLTALLKYFASMSSEVLADIFSTLPIESFPPVTGDVQQSITNILNFLEQQAGNLQGSMGSGNPSNPPALIAAGVTGTGVLLGGVLLGLYGYHKYIFATTKYGISAPIPGSGDPRWGVTKFGMDNDQETRIGSYMIWDGKEFQETPSSVEPYPTREVTDKTPRVSQARLVDAKDKRWPPKQYPLLNGEPSRSSVRRVHGAELESYRVLGGTGGRMAWKNAGFIEVPFVIEAPALDDSNNIIVDSKGSPIYRVVTEEADKLDNRLKNMARVTTVSIYHAAGDVVHLPWETVKQAIDASGWKPQGLQLYDEHAKKFIPSDTAHTEGYAWGDAPEWLGVGKQVGAEAAMYMTPKALRINHHTTMSEGDWVNYAYMVRGGVVGGEVQPAVKKGKVLLGENGKPIDALERYSGHYQPWYTEGSGTTMYQTANKHLREIGLPRMQFTLPTAEEIAARTALKAKAPPANLTRVMHPDKIELGKGVVDTEVGKIEQGRQAEITKAKVLIAGGLVTGALSPLASMEAYKGSSLLDNPSPSDLAKQKLFQGLENGYQTIEALRLSIGETQDNANLSAAEH